MDDLLSDELLEEIIRRLPPSSSPAISLVSKRWLSALHSSTTNLSLSIPNSHFPLPLPPSPSTVLSRYPNLSSLTILLSPLEPDPQFPPPHPPLHFSSDSLLLSVAAAPFSPRLINLRFYSPASPISSSALTSSSPSLKNLTNLHLTIPPLLPPLALPPPQRQVPLLQLLHPRIRTTRCGGGRGRRFRS